jgi:hypothetical protein
LHPRNGAGDPSIPIDRSVCAEPWLSTGKCSRPASADGPRPHRQQWPSIGPRKPCRCTRLAGPGLQPSGVMARLHAGRCLYGRGQGRVNSFLIGGGPAVCGKGSRVGEILQRQRRDGAVRNATKVSPAVRRALISSSDLRRVGPGSDSSLADDGVSPRASLNVGWPQSLGSFFQWLLTLVPAASGRPSGNRPSHGRCSPAAQQEHCQAGRHGPAWRWLTRNRRSPGGLR